MQSLFKHPRALVRNEAKLKQLQEKVYLPLFHRVQEVLNVARFARLPLRNNAIQVPSRELVRAKGIEHEFKGVIEDAYDLVGPLSLLAPQGNGRLGLFDDPFMGQRTHDVSFPIIQPVLMRNGKEHEPEIMRAWEELEPQFIAATQKYKLEAEAIQKEFQEKYGVPEFWGSHDTAHINYALLSLAFLNWRLGIPYNPQLYLRSQGTEISLDGTGCASDMGEDAQKLYDEMKDARGKVTLRDKFTPEMKALAAKALEIMDALREVLALVPGERPPLEYDALAGVLSFEDKSTRFNQATLAKAIFDHLVLYRVATQQELLDIRERIEKGIEPEKKARKASKEAVDPKQAVRTAIKEVKDKLQERGIPLDIETNGPQYKLSQPVHLPEF